MPALEQSVIDDLQRRLNDFLCKKGSYGAIKFLDAGGSAAVFSVEHAGELRAIKVFDPKFLNGPSGPAERRRLDVQRRLIGHDCPHLVQVYDILEAEQTAFTEMEFIAWPQLGKCLADVPDEQVHLLISQLVVAVRYLEARDIVHRDIKPENIHVSADFKDLKLLDLGVARAFEVADGEEATLTDTGQTRPFVATAQYSSPEYLFRLEAPTARLWKALNFYQVGAVLHDLIMKRPLFDEEVKMGNRWLVARAVLAKIPSFAESNPSRLVSLKALAHRCLTKDLDTRLDIVDWNEFARDAQDDPLSRLRGRLLKAVPNAAKFARQAHDGKLQFERRELEKRFTELLRAELIGACEGKVALTLRPPQPSADAMYRFELAVSDSICIVCFILLEWLDGLQNTTAKVRYASYLTDSSKSLDETINTHVACAITIGAGETEAARVVTDKLAEAYLAGLDIIEVKSEDIAVLHGTDLTKNVA